MSLQTAIGFIKLYQGLILKIALGCVAFAAMEAGIITAIRHATKPQAIQAQAANETDIYGVLDYAAEPAGQSRKESVQQRLDRIMTKLQEQNDPERINELITEEYLAGGISDKDLDFIISVARIPKEIKEELQLRKRERQKKLAAMNKIISPERLAERSTRFPP